MENTMDSIRIIPENLPTGRHTDWPFFLRWVPRRWTILRGVPPRRWLGTTPLAQAIFHGAIYEYPPPIPPRGFWHVVRWPLYFAFQTNGGWHGRIGIRFDDLAGYFQIPSLTLKHYK
jgi:hypothetical protein